MAKLDASQVQCQVLTYKEGLLSAVAHDLKLDVKKLSIDFDPDSKKIDATFDPTSLSVRCAMKDGEERLDTLSARDKRDIEDNIAKDVLVTKKHREIRFRSTSVSETGGVYRVSGTLQIKGQTRDVTFDLRNSGDSLEAKIRLHQPDYGVKPFSAMLGALKIKPNIDVLVKLPKKLIA